eukprot:16424013-Heterocapsa_arctica.AAC.1
MSPRGNPCTTETMPGRWALAPSSGAQSLGEGGDVVDSSAMVVPASELSLWPVLRSLPGRRLGLSSQAGPSWKVS